MNYLLYIHWFNCFKKNLRFAMSILCSMPFLGRPDEALCWVQAPDVVPRSNRHMLKEWSKRIEDYLVQSSPPTTPFLYSHACCQAPYTNIYNPKPLIKSNKPHDADPVMKDPKDPQDWYCCQCKNGPMLIATTDRCTGVCNGHQCGHGRCDDCAKERGH